MVSEKMGSAQEQPDPQVPQTPLKFSPEILRREAATAALQAYDAACRAVHQVLRSELSPEMRLSPRLLAKLDYANQCAVVVDQFLPEMPLTPQEQVEFGNVVDAIADLLGMPGAEEAVKKIEEAFAEGLLNEGERDQMLLQVAMTHPQYL